MVVLTQHLGKSPEVMSTDGLQWLMAAGHGLQILFQKIAAKNQTATSICLIINTLTLTGARLVQLETFFGRPSWTVTCNFCHPRPEHESAQMSEITKWWLNSVCHCITLSFIIVISILNKNMQCTIKYKPSLTALDAHNLMPSGVLNFSVITPIQ